MNKTQLDKTLGTIKNYIDSTTKPKRILEKNGTSGKTGFIAMAKMVITDAYVNRPIEFKFIQRGRQTPCTVSIEFLNIDSKDPGLASLKYMGTDFGVFMYKTAASTWLLYVTKSEAYDAVTLVENNTAPQNVTITYPGTFIETKPTNTTDNPVVNATLGYTVGTAATCSGNAATATKLATAKNINGTSFDGSANITTANWGAARTLTIGNKAQSVNGSQNITWSLSDIGAAPKSHTHNYAGSSSAGGAADSSNVLNSNSRMDYGWNGLNYFNISGTAGNAAKANDTPTSAWWHIIRCNHGNASGFYTDIAVPFNAQSMYYKRITSGAVQDGGWVKLLDAKNYSEYNTYNSLTVNASTAYSTTYTKAGVFSDTNTKLSLIKFNSASGSSDPGAIYLETSSTEGDTNKGVLHLCPSDDSDAAADYVSIHGTNDAENIKLFTAGNATFASTVTAPTFKGNVTGNVSGSSGSCTGNAATATKLQTARKIGNASFDGSSSVNLKTIMGNVSASSSTDANNNKYIRIASVNVSGAPYTCCSGILAMTPAEGNGGTGLLKFYFRTNNVITSAGVTLNWLTLDNSSYASSISAVKTSDGKFDIYMKASGAWHTQNFTAIDVIGRDLLSFHSEQSYVAALPSTAVATSSYNNPASILATARTFSLTGDVTGSASFDGSANVSITATVANDSHSHSNYLPLSGGTLNGNITFTGVTSTTYPAKSNTITWNGSTDGADIYYQVDASDKGRLVLNTRDDADCIIMFANNGTSKSTIDNSGNFSGNASTATKLATARTLTIGSTGKTFNGSANVSWTLDEIGAAPRSHTHDYIYHRDTRAVNEKPDEVQQGLSIHLKTDGADGLSDGGTYHPSIHIKPWNDHSGGPYGELALTQNQNLWFRTSSSGTAWNAWKKVSLDGHTHSYLPLSGGTLTGPVTVSGESKFHNGTYSDPLTGTQCAIKASGHVAVGGTIYEGGTSLSNKYAPKSHNHTSLTGITSLTFASESTDKASIGTTISSANTYMDFKLADDAGTDAWRWRFAPSGGSEFNAMYLSATSTTAAQLSVTGNIQGTTLTASGNSKTATMGTGSGDVYFTNSKSGKYLQLKDDGTLAYSDAKVALNYGTIERLTTTAWFYSTGETGWYNSTYGGGWYMTDANWLRSYNGKGVYTPGQMKCGDNFTLDTSGKAVIVKITGGAAYEGLKGGGDGVCVGDNGTKLYLRHKTQINIENSSYTRKLANISSSGGVDMGDTSCRLSLHSNDNPIFWNGSNGYDVVTMSSMDAAHNKIRYGSGLGGANGYITFSW